MNKYDPNKKHSPDEVMAMLKREAKHHRNRALGIDDGPIYPFLVGVLTAIAGIALASLVSGCAGLPIRVDDADDVRAVVSAADVLVSNVAPVCEAASPLPREHPCLLLPTVTTGLDRVRAALADENEQAAIDEWHRVAPAVEALAGVLR